MTLEPGHALRVAVIAPTFGRGPEFKHPTPIIEVAREVGDWAPFTGGTNPHDRSRCLLQTRAMQTEADAFLWIDDDIEATKEQCVQICDVFGMYRDISTLTGIYICRHEASKGRVAFNFNPKPPEQGEPPLDIPFGDQGGVFKVTAHGAGFFVVSRKCLESLNNAPEVIYEGVESKAWFLPEVVDKIHLGEDRSFTWRVLDQYLYQESEGFEPVWPMCVDSRILVGHAGYKITPNVEKAATMDM